MTSSKHIALLSSASFLIALIFVWTFVNTNESQFDDNLRLEMKFYKEKISLDEKNIFIVGSSQVARINATYVNQILTENNVNYKVYNLGKPRDLPTDRLKVIESLIESKPELVLYGIGFRDFGYSSQLKSNIESSVRSVTCEQLSTNYPLPSPKDALPLELIFENYYEELSPLGQPKQTTLETIRNFLGINVETKFSSDPYAPFYTISPISTEIVSENELKNIINDFCFYPNSELGKIQIIGIEKILHKLNENKINTILFVTPHDKFFLEMLSDEEKINFKLALTELSNKYSIPVIFSLTDKYQNMQVWNHFNHIATNQSASIFSHDISDILMENLT